MFITFEGIEGAGKGTIIKRVFAMLKERGQEVLVTREPGGSALGVSLRSMLLNTENTHIGHEAELFMYLADRAQHMQEVIRPALAAGRIVMSDRFADSTIVYQGYGRGLPTSVLYQLNDFAVRGFWPDLTIVLDLEPELGLERARKRNAELGLSVSEGRFEAETLNFHTRVRNGYRLLAMEHSERMVLVDASAPEDKVFAKTEKIISERFNF